MARTRTISNHQILEAARILFTEKGLSATSAEIAKRAGVSEGTIFRRFANKEALYHAAMGIEFPPKWFDLTEEGALEGDFHTQLSTLLVAIAEFFNELVPCIMLTRSHDLDPRTFFPNDLPQPPPVLAVQRLQTFIERAQTQGHVRADADASTISRTCIGALSHYGMMKFIGWNPIDPSTFVEDVIRTLWIGIAPRNLADDIDSTHPS